MPLATPSTGIEELVDESSGKEIVATQSVIDKFADLTKKYDQFAVLTEYDWKRWLRNHVQEVVPPCDINIFLQQTREYENHKNYGFNTGIFISQLIQNSYKAGNNDFEFDVILLKPIDRLASAVSGTEEQVVRVVVNGEVGNGCGSWAQHSTFTIEKTGDVCGQFAQHSTFTIEKAGNGCGFAAKNSTFKTHNSLQYERFKKSVSQDRSNELYLLAVDGSIFNGGKW